MSYCAPPPPRPQTTQGTVIKMGALDSHANKISLPEIVLEVHGKVAGS